MTATDSHSAPGAPPSANGPTVVLDRRTVDRVLVAAGALVTVVLLAAGAMLSWGSSFSSDYVGDELSSQKISFPSAEALTAEGRTDLLKYAGEVLDTGKEAEAYASYIDGHLAKTANGATYAELGGPERAARAAVTAAQQAGKPQAEIDELQKAADTITGQRDTLFRGETLRGLLLSAYAWSTVGSIAGIAATVAYVAAAIMAILVVLGIVHQFRQTRRARA